MKTNVVYLNQDYYVNPKKKSVCCKLIFGIDLEKIPGINMLVQNQEFNDFIDELTNSKDGVAYYDSDASSYGMLVFETIGLAKCDPKDNFDESLGKKISSTRAQQDAFESARIIYDNILAIVEDTFDNLYGLLDGSIKASKKCKNHVYDLTNYKPNY